LTDSLVQRVVAEDSGRFPPKEFHGSSTLTVEVGIPNASHLSVESFREDCDLLGAEPSTTVVRTSRSPAIRQAGRLAPRRCVDWRGFGRLTRWIHWAA
jgi:hypothetical protein